MGNKEEAGHRLASFFVPELPVPAHAQGDWTPRAYGTLYHHHAAAFRGGADI